MRRFICLAGALLAVILMAVIFAGNGLADMKLALVFLAAAVLLGFLVFRVLPQLPHWVYLLIAGLLCAGLRLLAIVLLPVDTLPSHDFGAYFRLAENVAEKGDYIKSSANLFPHMLFYSLVLSVPFRLFGTSILTYQLCGVALSLAGMLLLYGILLGFAGRRAAFYGSLVWACEPVLILYAPLNCNEHLSLALILLYMFLLFRMERNPVFTVPCWLLRGSLLGLNLLVLNLIRPVGIILAIATLLYLLVRHWKAFRQNWIYACTGLLAAVLLLTVGKALVYRAADGIRVEPLSTSSHVFTLLVGSNYDAGGSWNEADSKLFLDTVKATYETGYDYDKAYDKLMGVVRERYRAMTPRQASELLLLKNETLWGGQKSVVNYLEQYRDEAQPSLLDHPMAVNLMRDGCDSFMPVLLLIMAAACCLEIRKKNGTPVLWCIIAMLGFICLYCLTEAAGRYTVMALPMLIVTAATLCSELLGRRERNCICERLYPAL